MAHRQLPSNVEYSYVYVAELEFSNVGCWIRLERDKSLSLENLRSYFPTCFGIKYRIVDTTNGTKIQYIRYHSGYFRFPPALDLNNTRFVAYYYNDIEDIRAFMEMIESDDNGGMHTASLRTPQNPPDRSVNENSSLLCRTMDLFHMDRILQRGAQSTPVKNMAQTLVPQMRENVSSTSDVILNEPTIEVISVQDTQNTIPFSMSPLNPACSSGIKAKLGPTVSSTSDEGKKSAAQDAGEKITISDSSTMVAVKTINKSKSKLKQHRKFRPDVQGSNARKEQEVISQGRERAVQQTRKILKIEDNKGRTTALLTKKKWSETVETRGQKRRFESADEHFEKRRRIDNAYRNPQQSAPKQIYTNTNNHIQLNVLLVGFQNQRPIDQETVRYFSDFGVVTNFQVSPQQHRHNRNEYYAFMTIRTNNAISLFSDRHLYNGAIVYAIRVDGNRPPSKITCKLCGYYGLNVGYLHYHVEGQCHQRNLMQQLESRAVELGQMVYLDSYYRITSDELYVQFAANGIHDVIRNDYWKRCRQPVTEARPNFRNLFNRVDDVQRYC